VEQAFAHLVRPAAVIFAVDGLRRPFGESAIADEGAPKDIIEICGYMFSCAQE